jgi:hypothetical protein
MRGQALAFWVREPGAGEIRPVRLPQLGAAELAGRSLRSGISRVTETLVFRGHTPENQYDALRATFPEWDFPGLVPHDYLEVGVAPDDAQAPCGWLGDADLRRQLRHAAEQRHVTRSGWSATADQISHVITEAL